jgi:hypothetical protein
LIACAYFTAGWQDPVRGARSALRETLLRARRQKAQTKATRAFSDDGLLFDFEMLVDIFALDAQFTGTLAIGTGNTLETHG